MLSKISGSACSLIPLNYCYLCTFLNLVYLVHNVYKLVISTHCILFTFFALVRYLLLLYLFLDFFLVYLSTFSIYQDKMISEKDHLSLALDLLFIDM